MKKTTKDNGNQEEQLSFETDHLKNWPTNQNHTHNPPQISKEIRKPFYNKENIL